MLRILWARDTQTQEAQWVAHKPQGSVTTHRVLIKGRKIFTRENHRSCWGLFFGVKLSALQSHPASW